MFLACSFWLVDAYLMLGRRDDAVRLFERLLALRNDVGLLSEEYDPHARRLVGNFPQAFSHLVLVNSASNLAHYRKPAEQRAEAEGEKKPPQRAGVSEGSGVSLFGSGYSQAHAISAPLFGRLLRAYCGKPLGWPGDGLGSVPERPAASRVS